MTTNSVGKIKKCKDLSLKPKHDTYFGTTVYSGCGLIPRQSYVLNNLPTYFAAEFLCKRKSRSTKINLEIVWLTQFFKNEFFMALSLQVCKVSGTLETK